MEIFIRSLLKMSLYGSIAIVAILLLRFIFRRFPKRITILFWIVAAVRLVCPMNFTSHFSLMNFVRTENAIHEEKLVETSADTAKYLQVRKLVQEYLKTMDEPVNNTAKSAVTDANAFSAENILFMVWAIGVALCLGYLVYKAIKLFSAMKKADKDIKNNYFESNLSDEPFVVGVIKPSIWIPAGISESEKKYILLHENIHIRNNDNLIKLLGMVIALIHWFNPLIWIAYRLMISDLEMRCDEEVVRILGDDIKKNYCTSIVCRAMNQRRCGILAGSSFARKSLGGMEVKMRIKNLLNTKVKSKVLAVSLSVVAIGGIILVSSASANAKKNNAEDVVAEEVTPEENEDATEALTIETTEMIPEVEEAETKESPEGAEAEPEAEEETVPEEATSEGRGLPLADTPSTDEELINHGYENYTFPEDTVFSDEGVPFSNSYDYRQYADLAEAVEPYVREGYKVFNEPTEFLDEDGNIQTGKELYTVYFGDFVEGVKYYSGSAAFKSLNYCKEYFDDEDFNGTTYEREIILDDGFRIYRSYNPETNVMIEITFMEGKYASGSNEVVEEE